ncbi:MAG: regulatory protein RecX [Pseudomonadota bacterium]
MNPNDDTRVPQEEIRYRTAMDTAVRLLTNRRHTRWELARKLAGRGVGEDTAAAVIATCERLGYVDDAETALFYIDELKAKGYGRRHIRFAMQKKGFDEALIDDGITRRYPPAEETDAALRMALKKRKSLSGKKADRALREKTYRYLYSRGFSADAVNDAMSAAFTGDP